MNPRNFTATQAAILHSEYPVAHEAKPASLPAMIWSTNYGRLASQTLFTLFFAGKHYAPKCMIDGQNIQDYLQSHFIAAFGELADRIRDAGDLYDECIIGWDSMNEPAEGFCGYEDLNTVPAEQGSTLRKGSHPTPAQSLRLGMGQKQTVEHWDFGAFGPKCDGTVTIDPKGHKMWMDPEAEAEGVNEQWGWKRSPEWKLGICIWALHRVWDVESGYILRPDYFRCPPFDPDRPVVFETDFWRPHWREYRARIRDAHPEAIHFVQPPVFAQPPPLDGPDDLRGRCCYSGHYYDGLTLVTRHWNWFNADALGLLRGKYKATWMAAKIGEKAIRQSLQEQLGILKSDTEIIGAYPTLIGEIGTPFDMDGKRSYGYTDGGKHTGDYSNQQKALDASLNAADGPNSLNYTIWTYCPDSSHEWGDGWNMEDLSLWSADDLRPIRRVEAYRMRAADSSKAALLQKKSTDAIVRVKQVESALSLATIGGGSLAPSFEDGLDDPLKGGDKFSTLITRPHWSNPYDFLTDGARAVRAFCRPFPVSVVGTPTHIAFDIAKAEFKLTVRVRAEDRPVVSSAASASGSSLSSSATLKEFRARDSEDDAELPTEIYIPLVHYARRGILSQSLLASETRLQCEQREQAEQERTEPSTPAEYADGEAGADGDAVDGPAYRDSPAQSFSSASTLPAADASLVDVDVRVSAGRWAVEGQYLRWWYPVPAEGTGAIVEHTIEIRRTGGPIRLLTERTGAAAAGGSLFGGLCERFCPPDLSGCVIM